MATDEKIIKDIGMLEELLSLTSIKRSAVKSLDCVGPEGVYVVTGFFKTAAECGRFVAAFTDLKGFEVTRFSFEPCLVPPGQGDLSMSIRIDG